MPNLDTKTVGSPGWWLVRLEKKLTNRCTRYDLLEKYYSGDHPLPEGDDRMRDLFRKFQKKARTNYMRLVADSVSERLQILGFRTGTGADATDDHDAWRIWQSNHLDADSSMAHVAASKFSDCYVLVGPADDDGDDAEDNPDPIITIEDPRNLIAETDPVNRRVIRAAAKIWLDEVDGKRHAVLYLPDAFYYFESESPVVQQDGSPEARAAASAVSRQTTSTWVPEIVDDEGESEDESFDSDPNDVLVGSRVLNPIAPIIPVVRLVTNSDLAGEGMAEFEDVIDVQDRINDTMLNRLVVSKMQAYRQRWAKGIASEDEDGNELPLPFIPGVDLLWTVEDDTAAFGDFEQADLAPFLGAIKDDVQAIVTLTGLPPHYVAGSIVNASADALAGAETRLVSRCQARQRQYGESWEAVMRLAFRYLEQTERIAVGAAVQWASAERQSIAQLADAATKKQAAGVPWRQNMRDLGYDPLVIDEMESDRVSDAMLNPTPSVTVMAGAPPAPPAPAPAPAPNAG